ncbi:MAG: efflux RND transporter periplasmic adaptor subunit [Vicinamibacterales bacterium]
MTRNGFLLLPLVVIAAAAAACAGGEPTVSAEPAEAVVPAVDVAVVSARTGRIDSVLEISGTLAPRARVGVKAKLPGTLERILVDIGDEVRAGQTLATIDRREIDAQADAAEAAVAVARASLDAAEATLANAETERTRAQNLFEKGALPRQRLDAAETAARAGAAQRDLAKATLAQAEASRRRAREVQNDATVVAPVSGYVVARNYDPGALPGTEPIVVIADMKELKLEAGVSELEAGRLRIGMAASVSVQAKPGEQFTGELVAIAPEVDERNRHFQVEVRVANSDRALLSGMYATADLVVASADNAVLVPREAIISRGGQRVVLKVTGESISEVPVTEGLTDGRQVQVVTGLATGDQVVADARRQVPAGARVHAVPVQ